MKLKEYITASVKPVGSPVMLSKSKVYACDVGPSWSWLKNEVVEANNDITIDAFKTYWTNRYNSKELEYPNIFWAHQDDFVERNIYKDEIGNCFIKLQNGWAPVVSSFKLGQLVFFMHPEHQPSLARECGLVFAYPWAKEYGRRI